MKPKLNLGFHLFLVSHVGVVNKGATPRVWRLVSGGGILKTFDDGLWTSNIFINEGIGSMRDAYCFSTTIVADDNGDRAEKFNDGYVLIVERSYPSNGKLVQTSH